MLLAESLLGSSSVEANYIEDVFSTWLYTGNGSTQTITNGIDLAGKGGLVWNKSRSSAFQHSLTDTVRGAGNSLDSSDTAANDFTLTRISSFLSNGFTMGGNSRTNANGTTYASWTFREQPKFFDIVTYTGNGVAGRVVSHNLQSVPGCIIIKRTNLAQDWVVWHRAGSGGNNFGALNSAAAFFNGDFYFNNTPPTSTSFTVNADQQVNQNGDTYVAYLFAHNAGGFGATGTDNVISCGSFTTDGSGNASVTLGYEPQWLLVKNASDSGNWWLQDTMRGMTVSNSGALLWADLSNAEAASNFARPNSTGFTHNSVSSSTFIYIAIRRGPMRTPTTGTSVFSPIASSAAAGTALTTGFPVDAQIFSLRTGTTNKGQTVDRLRGISSNATESGAQLLTPSTAAETTGSIPTLAWNNTGFQMPSSYGGASMVFWNFGRAPGFFDVVCYTGDGTSTRANVPMNLGVTPELVFIKARSTTSDWFVGNSLGFNNRIYYFSTFRLNTTAAFGTTTQAYLYAPPVSTFGVPDAANVNGTTYVAYLFASCPGVSKVGSYTGTGATQTVNCGFAAGARFVLIKRTDSTGDWYVWDSARGIVAGNDPYVRLNSTAAEVTTTDWVDTVASGFELSNAAGNLVNTNGASYIFLAVS